MGTATGVFRVTVGWYMLWGKAYVSHVSIYGAVDDRYGELPEV